MHEGRISANNRSLKLKTEQRRGLVASGKVQKKWFVLSSPNCLSFQAAKLALFSFVAEGLEQTRPRAHFGYSRTEALHRSRHPSILLLRVELLWDSVCG